MACHNLAKASRCSMPMAPCSQATAPCRAIWFAVRRGAASRMVGLCCPFPCRFAPWCSAAGVWAAPPFRPCRAWGFSCTLFDCRPEFTNADKSHGAQQAVVGDYNDIAASLTLDERNYVLIMTHSHQHDFAVLEQVLRKPLAYVGFMGSRRKIATARERMLEAGISESALEAVHMPIGLDIKAETPEEMAVSIAAECILHRATR